MKKMKKLLAILLSMLLALSALSACGEKEDAEDKGKEKVEEKQDGEKEDKKKADKKKEKKSDEDLAREAAEGFMDAYVDLDSKGMGKYVDDTSAIPEDFEGFFKEQFMSGVTSSIPAELEDFADDFEDIGIVFIDKMKDGLSYEITDVEEDDDKFTFVVELTVPDVTSVDVEQLIMEQFDEDVATELVEEMIESGELSETSSDEEILAAVLPKVFGEVKKLLADVEFETQTNEQELVVTKVDGEWLVNAEESNL